MLRLSIRAKIYRSRPVPPDFDLVLPQSKPRICLRNLFEHFEPNTQPGHQPKNHFFPSVPTPGNFPKISKFDFGKFGQSPRNVTALTRGKDLPLGAV